MGQMQDTTGITTELEANIRLLNQRFNASDDVRVRPFNFNGMKGSLLYLTTVTDKDQLQVNILKPLLQAREVCLEGQPLEDILPILDLERVTDLEAAASAMLHGYCAILLDGRADLLMADASASIAHSISESQNEQTIRGSQESFIDDAGVNAQLIHRRLRNTNLTERHFTLGTSSPTCVTLLYMCDLADMNIVGGIIDKLNMNRDEFIKSPGQILEKLENSHYSPFPQMLLSERPDTTVAHLMEGRAVLLVDGSAYAAILPVTFFMFFQVQTIITLDGGMGPFSDSYG